MRNISLKTIGALALAISVIPAALMSGNRSAQADAAQSPCGVHTLRGSYVFNAHGWDVVGGVATPKAIVEGIDFNGDGNLVSPFATISINGTILQFSGVAGSYTVNQNCTGTLTFPGIANFDIFVQPGDGKQVWMIQTGPTVPGPPVFEGTAKKVSP